MYYRVYNVSVFAVLLLCFSVIKAEGAVSFIAETSAAGSGTTCVPNVPAGTTTNDLLVLEMFGSSGATATAAGTSDGATTFSGQTGEDTLVGGHIYVLTRVFSGTEGTTITGTLSSGSTPNCILMTFRGENTTTPLDPGTPNPQVANGSPSPASVAGFTTTSANGDFLVALLATQHTGDTGGVWSAPAGWGNGINLAITTGGIAAFSIAQPTSGPIGTVSSAWSGSSPRWAMELLAIQAASSTPPVQSGGVILAMGYGNFVPSPSPSPSPTPSATPTPGAGPTPIPLVSPQTIARNTVVNGCTIHGDGMTDDTSCIQTAINSHDIMVMPGVYQISGKLTINGGRNIRGCTDPNSNCSSTVANYCPSGNANVNSSCAGRPVAAFQYTTDTQNHVMIQMWSSNNSIYGLQIRGPNYNTSGAPHCDQLNWSYNNLNITGGQSNNQIDFNDFNGSAGDNGGLELSYGSPSGGVYPVPNNTTISYNHFEHCNGRAIEISSATNTHMNHNLYYDCQSGIECWLSPGSQYCTGNVWDNENLTFTFGTGMGQGCTVYSNNHFVNNITPGVACDSPNTNNSNPCPFDYSGNTVSNTICNSTMGHEASIWGHSANNIVPGRFIGNTVLGACINN